MRNLNAAARSEASARHAACRGRPLAAGHPSSRSQSGRAIRVTVCLARKRLRLPFPDQRIVMIRALVLCVAAGPLRRRSRADIAVSAAAAASPAAIDTAAGGSAARTGSAAIHATGAAAGSAAGSAAGGAPAASPARCTAGSRPSAAVDTAADDRVRRKPGVDTHPRAYRQRRRRHPGRRARAPSTPNGTRPRRPPVSSSTRSAGSS